jgi:aspartate/methionine/tyrosine aminotransferase
MVDKLPEWFILVKQTPGEKYHLATPGRYPAKLGDAFGALDMEQSLDWSGHFYGVPAILDYIIETQDYDVKPENVLPVNGGTSMGIFLTCMAVLKQGDEVICETPAWTQVANICRRMGIKVKWWCLRRDNEWKPDLEELKSLINPKTKLIYINHPNNPTGSVISRKEMIELCKIASEYGSYILSDEIYRGVEWESDTLSPSVVNHYDRAVSTSSLSKVIGATGIRFGWFVTQNKHLYDDCFAIYYDSVLCHNSITERIGERLLEPSKYHQLLKEGKNIGRENLTLLSEMAEKNEQWSMIFPGGAYCCFLGYNTKEPSWDFCERMLKKKPKGVALVPGIAFNGECEYHIRIGFGGKPDFFRAALKLVEEGAGEYKG